MEPEFNSISLESQSIGCFTSSQPLRAHTSCAKSKSNPTYSPLSSLYPYGGYSASNPTINCLSEFSLSLESSVFVSFFADVSASLLLPQPAIVNTIAAAISTAANPVALFIKKSSFFIHCTLVYYHDKTVM